MGISNVFGAGLLSKANGDSLLSLLNASSSSVPGGGGLFTSNGATLLADLCGILNPFSDTKYSPVSN